ncbi:MAG: hypothetical protein ACTHXO_02845 [Actinomycetaceae bacterium]
MFIADASPADLAVDQSLAVPVELAGSDRSALTNDLTVLVEPDADPARLPTTSLEDDSAASADSWGKGKPGKIGWPIP